MRKIAVITGTRADYGILFPILRRLQKNKKIKLQLIVTGTHLSHEFGYTVAEIIKDGFQISAKVDMLLSDDTGGRMARSFGVGILELTGVFEILKPDVVIVLGDREEMFAAAFSSLCLNIPVAHIHGGDVGTGGHIDESIRHAITKFSHIHFPATKTSAQRIIKLGEESWRVFMVGAPSGDNVKNVTSVKILAKKYSLDLNKEMIIIVQHPVTLSPDDSVMQIEKTMDAVVDFKLQTIVICPNSDTGGKKIIDFLGKYNKYKYIKIFNTLPFTDYLGLLKYAGVIVGNSSSAIIEAPVFKIPAVNIGNRQQGREMAENIINVNYDKVMIKEAISRALFDKKFRARIKKATNPYKGHNVSKKIVDILQKIDINEKLLHKKMTY